VITRNYYLIGFSCVCGSDVSIDGAVFERIYLPIEALA
jgi:hypothetical protein